MTAIRATEDPGIAIQFLHDEIQEIRESDDAAATIHDLILPTALNVPLAGPIMTESAEAIAEAIADRMADLVETDEGEGVEVVFPPSALSDGLWEVEAVRPLPSTVRSVSMAETFSMRSPTAPTGAAVGDDLYVFARDDDGRVLYNRSGADEGFSGWEEVPGELVSGTQPAAVSSGDEVLVFATDTEGRVHSNRVGANGAFTGWEEVPGDITTDGAVGVGSQADSVFVFARLDDNRIAFNRLQPDGTYTGWLDKSIAWRGA
ncbi:hypothetical protein [Streptomyces violaceusniger]|uniref:Uncharacterized protein n=1 Tax=Streptomyces violaceusniger (strain Tu 4113) TaxID=653045 RepID=G2P5F9_STRV4|nr:hypothetical protein [Streptomyces violaceusniger]AEM84772.1 hypothetical protein Strvi_5240 [Streptomyces violaceusniger Tu 4113]